MHELGHSLSNFARPPNVSFMMARVFCDGSGFERALSEGQSVGHCQCLQGMLCLLHYLHDGCSACFQSMGNRIRLDTEDLKRVYTS